jgi:prepilin-type N-terminal cleavage/methylation domain-containing protein
MPNKSKRAGFTLIELTMVMVIIAVLAAISMPIYLNLKTEGINKTEAYVMEQFRAAIKTKYLENIANGVDPDSAWPSQPSFAMMTQPPPYSDPVASWGFDSQDDVHWRIMVNQFTNFSFGPVVYSGDSYICCPHFSGYAYSDAYGGGITTDENTKGTVWKYIEQGVSSDGSASHNPEDVGSLSLYFEGSH